MSVILFIDESGHDLHEQPYEVLAGVAIEDRDLWNLISALRKLELEMFGCRYTDGARELKARKLLKRKTFRLANQMSIDDDLETRRALARAALSNGPQATKEQLTALALAKLEYVKQALILCGQFRVRAFASIVPRRAQRPAGRHFLRKDYMYLFERFYYYLEDSGTDLQGLVVFDELDKAQSHVLVDQMSQYFILTQKGATLAGRIIPEPFFVHSHLTTGVQLADLVAYLVGWGVRIKGMTEPARDELDGSAQLVLGLRYRTVREVGGNPNFVIWSFTLIDDLRTQLERGI